MMIEVTKFLPRLRSLKQIKRPKLIVSLFLLGGTFIVGGLTFINRSKVRVAGISAPQVAGIVDSKLADASPTSSGSTAPKNSASYGNLTSSEISAGRTSSSTNQSGNLSGLPDPTSTNQTGVIGGSVGVSPDASNSPAPAASSLPGDPELEKELNGLEQELSTLESNGDFDPSQLPDF